MEPVAALGIASNVIKTISYAHEVFSLVRRIRKDGSPDASLAKASARLSDLSGELQSKLNVHQQRKPLNPTQKILVRVAGDCRRASDNLREELEQIKWKTLSKGSNSKTQRHTFGQTLKFVLRKSKIDELEKEMTRIEQVMQTTILMMLYEWMSNGAATLKDTTRQKFNNRYNQDHKALADLVKALADLFKALTDLVKALADLVKSKGDAPQFVSKPKLEQSSLNHGREWCRRAFGKR